MPENFILPKDSPERGEQLGALGQRLQKKANEIVGKRRTIEERMYEDVRQTEGFYPSDIETAIKDANTADAFANITRNKCTAGESRLADTLLPIDGTKNFGLSPTPKPELTPEQHFELMDSMTSNVENFEKLEEEQFEEAKDSAEKMESRIYDQLLDSDYNSVIREVMRDGVRVGTGILKGPISAGRIRKRWDTDVETGVSSLAVVEDFFPSIERINPFDYFPDLSALNKNEAKFEFDRRFMTKKSLLDFALAPGVIKENVKEVLAEAPEKSLNTYRDDLRQISGVGAIADEERYELWTYHGPINKSELMVSGFFDKADESKSKTKILEDENEEFQGTVWLVNGRVLRAIINENSEGSPYKVFNWEKSDGSIFGYGIPYILRNSQRVLNAVYRMMIDNGGLSAGPQIVYNDGDIEPADGIWELKARKLWKYTGDDEAGVNNVFAVHQIQNNQTELLNLYQLTRNLMDEETNLPLSSMGENTPNSQDSATAQLLRMQASNVVMKRAAKNFDDGITKPLIADYYHYNMKFSLDQTIKGDFQINAKGSSSLVNREQQRESSAFALQLAIGSPELGSITKTKELWKDVLKTSHLDPNELVKTDDEIKESQAQVQEAQGQVAAIEQGKVQNDQAKVQISAKKLEQDGEIKAAELGIKQDQLELDAMVAEDDAIFKREKLQTDTEVAIAKAAAQEGLTIAEIEATIQKDAAQIAVRARSEKEKNRTQRDKIAIDSSLESKKLGLQEENLKKGFDTY